MGSFSSGNEEYLFFDAHEDIAGVSDSESDGPEFSGSDCGIDKWESGGFQYDVWMRNPMSVQERRRKFLRWMGLDRRAGGDLVDVCSDVVKGEIDRIMESSGAVLRNSASDDCLSSSQSSVSSWSNNDLDSHRGLGLGENFVCTLGNSDGAAAYNEDDSGQDSRLSRFRLLSVEQLTTAEEFENTSTSSPSAQQCVQREIEAAGDVVLTRRRMKNRWLSRLRSMTCIVDREGRGNDIRHNSTNPFHEARIQRVRVRHYRKRSKELSGLFTRQDIQAHEGSILTMKFSPDGQYLASAGEDKVIRIWQVIEDERSNEIDIPDIDPSCIYFTVNQLTELSPLVTEREKMTKFKVLRKTADSACVIFPPKVFRILEKSIYEFHGHGGEILDLSWSNNNCLLSSSVDKTVRLWQVGCEHCLKVFTHSNYVTCIQFNPMDDNFFISGSIDGKVRVWAINSCQVVDWTDVRDIVTAVAYQPDGQGGIIGCLTGNCQFFKLVDNHFHLEARVCLNSKKKSPHKRITGLQFFPHDSGKVMVTCGDSQVRILDGVDLIGKYKGPRNAINQISAFFTADGRHIVSACEDSNVYIWNFSNQEEFSVSYPKTIRSFECFSTDASVAIPWSGMKLGNSENEWQICILDDNLLKKLPFSSSVCFSLGQEYCLESIPKGSATWPEENLPSSSPLVVPSNICKSRYKFFKTSCQSLSKSHAWGLVIVTAGWDGRIRFFQNYGLPTNTSLG